MSSADVQVALFANIHAMMNLSPRQSRRQVSPTVGGAVEDQTFHKEV
jgi:hypothetical protein